MVKIRIKVEHQAEIGRFWRNWMDESIQFPGSEFGLDGELEIRSTFDQVRGIIWACARKQNCRQMSGLRNYEKNLFKSTGLRKLDWKQTEPNAFSSSSFITIQKVQYWFFLEVYYYSMHMESKKHSNVERDSGLFNYYRFTISWKQVCENNK